MQRIQEHLPLTESPSQAKAAEVAETAAAGNAESAGVERWSRTRPLQLQELEHSLRSFAW